MINIQEKIRNVIRYVIVLISTLIVLSIIYLGSNTVEDPIQKSLSLIGNYVGAIATLAAAYIASLLFNDWKDEKKYELEHNLLTRILAETQPINVELLRIRSNANNLKDIDTKFIIKTDYLGNDSLDLFSSTLHIFTGIKTYSVVKNDDHLISLYDKFDKHCYCFIGFYKILFSQKYRHYYDKAIRTNEELKYSSSAHYDIFKYYSNDEKVDLAIEITEILKVFKENGLAAEIDGTAVRTTYDKLLNETIDYLKEIQDHCIEGLKVPE